MSARIETEVIVVGAGPVGLLAALALRDAGVAVEVVDANRRTGLHSYATVLHADTLRLLAGLGLVRACEEHGRVVSRVGLYEGADRRGELDVAAVGGPFPHLLVLPQSRLESILEDALAARGVSVRWEHRVQGFEPGADGVDLSIAKLDVESTGYPIARQEQIVAKSLQGKARFVVGADGWDSFVRRRLAIANPGHGPSERFSVYQCEVDGPIPDEARVWFSGEGAGVYWPMAGGRCRFSFPIASEEAHRPDLATLGARLAAAAPWFAAPVRGLEWTAHALFERRLAASFGSGRTWLVGDAAHLTGPIGAQSLNAGLREALDLAGRLVDVLERGAPPEPAFGSYEATCRTEWRRLLGVDGRLRGAPGPWTDGFAAMLLPAIPATGTALDLLLRQIGLELSDR